MNVLIAVAFASLAVIANAAPSGHGIVVAGPAGIVTGHGAIGPIGHGLGLAAPIGAPWGVNAWGVNHGAVLAAPVGLGYGLGLGAAGVITNGGGAVSVSGHGASVQGPPTAPAVIAGPSGKIVADGLWGPTANVGHAAVVGHGAWW